MLADNVADMLSDGRWHSIRTIARKLRRPEQIVGEVLRFCSEYDLVVLDRSCGKVKIDEKLRRILL